MEPGQPPLYSGGGTSDADVAAALAVVDQVLAALAGPGDNREKFHAYSVLANGLRARADTAAAGRRTSADAIRQAEKLNLAPLAEELGISTTRLHQLLNPKKEK